MSDDRLARIENKIDKQSDRLALIESTLAAQHVSLKDHIRRTELLEKTAAAHERDITMTQGALKLLSIIAVVLELINYIKH